ncbi:pilus assembly FimT family protein [Parahaliea aestuarii]|uniref:Prepilin-type N-terminal cleavage/methylation domain-containing protein n=1 Tax=Parahaliea aestuarii TaxID=1852021 RepID=A0A5C8ZQJ7_9GAMM|nr:prepilin-type N-terminal cleavage/methylation domain-containing protein [Parahaliea aestuarii]TXS90074.1 prepilin-type N-terminal cleavage/methylation domain-containing protein [Parahaliea aestuarii]
MWVTGVSTASTTSRRSGFTLLELVAALAIASIVVAVAVPASVRLYDSMRYREAVRDVIGLLVSARYRAITSGQPQNVEVVPRERLVRLGGQDVRLPEGFKLAVESASELNRQDTGIIRFYPEGGASGGGVDIESPRGRGISLRIDWLMGGVTQETYAAR